MAEKHPPFSTVGASRQDYFKFTHARWTTVATLCHLGKMVLTERQTANSTPYCLLPSRFPPRKKAKERRRNFASIKSWLGKFAKTEREKDSNSSSKQSSQQLKTICCPIQLTFFRDKKRKFTWDEVFPLRERKSLKQVQYILLVVSWGVIFGHFCFLRTSWPQTITKHLFQSTSFHENWVTSALWRSQSKTT